MRAQRLTQEWREPSFVDGNDRESREALRKSRQVPGVQRRLIEHRRDALARRRCHCAHDGEQASRRESPSDSQIA